MLNSKLRSCICTQQRTQRAMKKMVLQPELYFRQLTEKPKNQIVQIQLLLM